MHRFFAPVFLFCVSFVVPPLASEAAPITVPTGLNPGDQYRLVFVTSTTRDATSSDIADYNAFVTTAANSVPELAVLGTDWKAIASTSAIDALHNTGTVNQFNQEPKIPIYSLNGQENAVDYYWFYASTLDAPININEFGEVSADLIAWTGTYFDGTIKIPLGGLESEPGNPGASLGVIQDSQLWLNNSQQFTNDPRTNQYPLYAMSGVLTVLPEPSTMVPAVVGLLGLPAFGWRRRKR